MSIIMTIIALVIGCIGGAILGWLGIKVYHFLSYRKAKREIKTEMYRNQYYQNVYRGIITEDADKEALKYAKQMDKIYRQGKR